MNRLGLRLALAGGGRALVLTAVGVALGTAVLLLALTINTAIEARAERLGWRQPTAFATDPAATQTLVTYVNDAYGDRPLFRVLVAGTDAGAPVPPGLPSLPNPGTSYLSPALADLVAQEPVELLGRRFGEVVGVIGDRALADPTELVAIIGVTPEDLALGSIGLTSFEAAGDVPTPEGFLRTAMAIGIVGLLAPVGVFVATATRLSAARRAERLAAVRLVGASPAQAERLAAVEALVAGCLGAVGGIALFFVLRPFAALLPFNGHRWFVEDLVPEPIWAIAVIVSIPLVSAAAVLIELRDTIAAPLGTARRTAPPAVSARRLLPLVAAIGLLAATIAWEAGGGAGDPDTRLFAIGGAFLSVVAALVWAGPYLVTVVARILRRAARQPATLIAARRLEADPRAGFYSISGVMLAVFIGSVFHALIVPVQSSVDVIPASGLRPSTVSAVEVNQFQIGGGRLRSLVGELEAMENVERVVVERDVELFLGGGHVVRALVMSCDDARSVLAFEVANCESADLVAPGETVAPGTYDLAHLGVEPGETWTGTVSIDTATTTTMPNGVSLPALLDPGVVDGGVDDMAPSRILVATDGSHAAVERVRTAIEAAVPTAIALSGTDQEAFRTSMVDELGWLINFGLVAVMLVAGSSLAMSVIGSLSERRRPLGLLRLSGMPVGQLRRMVFIEAAGPLILASLATALAGVGVAQMIARIGRASDLGLPGISILVPVGMGIIGGLLVVVAVLPFLERATNSEATRFE